MSWYNDETYIKMCAAAEELRAKWTPEVGDWVARKSKLTSLYSVFVVGEAVKDGNYEIVRAVDIEDGNWVAFNPSCFIPLWSQEQLQWMLNYRNAYEFIRKFYQWLILQHDIQYLINPLLLRFVMQELHSKKWTGERWEVIR